MPLVQTFANASTRGWGEFLPNGAAGSFDLISTTILGSSATSVTFDVTGLGATYKHLQLRVAARTDRSAYVDTANIQFNNDTGSVYTRHYLGGNGSSAFSGADTSQTSMLGVRITGATAGTSVFGSGVVDLLDVFSSTKYKTIRSFSGYTTGSGSEIYLFSGLWTSTSAATSVKLLPNIGTNFVSGSRFSIYGIKG